MSPAGPHHGCRRDLRGACPRAARWERSRREAVWRGPGARSPPLRPCVTWERGRPAAAAENALVAQESASNAAKVWCCDTTREIIQDLILHRTISIAPCDSQGTCATDQAPEP
ncbi:uncharacterized protein J5F26_003620 isoform 1-T6 [Ciconia maguari]